MDTQLTRNRKHRPGGRSGHNVVGQNRGQGHRPRACWHKNSMGANRWSSVQHLFHHCLHTSQREDEANGCRHDITTAQTPAYSAQIRVHSVMRRLQLSATEECARVHRTMVYDEESEPEWARRRNSRSDARERPVRGMHTVQAKKKKVGRQI